MEGVVKRTDDFFGVAQVASGDLIGDVGGAERVIIAGDAVTLTHAAIIIVQAEDEEALYPGGACVGVGLDDIGGGFGGSGTVEGGPGSGGLIFVPNGHAGFGQPQRMWPDGCINGSFYLGCDVVGLVNIRVKVKGHHIEVGVVSGCLGIGSQQIENLLVEGGIAPIRQSAEEDGGIGIGVFGCQIAHLEQLGVFLGCAEPEAGKIGFIPDLPDVHPALEMADDRLHIPRPQVFWIVPGAFQFLRRAGAPAYGIVAGMSHEQRLWGALDDGRAVRGPHSGRPQDANNVHGDAEGGVTVEDGLVSGELVIAGRDFGGVPAEVEAIPACAGVSGQLHPRVIVEGVAETEGAVGFMHWRQRRKGRCAAGLGQQQTAQQQAEAKAQQV